LHDPTTRSQPFLEQAKILREGYDEALAAWEDEQKLRVDDDTLPRRSASVNAVDYVAAATGQQPPATARGASADTDTGLAEKEPRKRRRVGEYAGLGNLAEDVNDDLTCKACSFTFENVEKKRAHLLSRQHQTVVAETDAAQPARDIALTMPIFTDQFVEHYERREKALRELRQESDQLVRDNSVMVEQVPLLLLSLSLSLSGVALSRRVVLDCTNPTSPLRAGPTHL
jgi:hypothetical protein